MDDRLDALKHAVSPDTLKRAVEVSARLSELRIRHVLIEGLAVGVHGHPRATRDVDFLVGDEAFESSRAFLTYRPELGELVELAVTDLLGVPEALPSLERELELNQELSVISLEALVMMKLHAGRSQDLADV